MLFNSFEFIFLFFIPVFIIFKLAAKHLSTASLIWFLSLASLVFYAQWSYYDLPIVLISIIVNFLIAKKSSFTNSNKSRRNYLIVSIIFNLSLLGFFKYIEFFLSIFLIEVHFNISLPLAISFFTFQQIAFQVDLYQKKIKLDSFREYLFFVLFFPQLIAGPIVHYKEIVFQIKSKNWVNTSIINIQNGIFLFSVGLFKKVFIADSIALYINLLYEKISTTDISSIDLWFGLIAYSFKIYFDFSGYVDMALGVALMFGIILPINFNSPYKSYDIVDFWRRWHITLSNFLRDYLYIPLGGSKKGKLKTFSNLIITMFLGGLWHGAGWNFILWGLMHGLLLGANHYLREKFLFIKEKKFKILSVLITFFLISLLWVLFRAKSIDEAFLYYKYLFVDDINREIILAWIKTHMELFSILIFSLFTVWFLPNSNKLANSDKHMNLKAVIAGILFIISLKLMLGSPSQEFIYFQF